MPASYNKRVLYFLIGGVCLILIFFSDYLGFFRGIDAYVYDMSFRIRGAQRHSERIVIASIDEKTLAKYGRWPIKRIYYAQLIDKMRQASVVGFDVIFAERSEDDTVFAEAIKKHGRIIMPIYIDRELNKIGPLPLLSPFETGHIHIAQDIDNVVREVFQTLYHNSIQLPSLSSVVYEAASGKKMSREDVPAAYQDKEARQSILQMDHLKINYYGKPGTFQHISVSDVIEGEFAPDFFKDKVVLVGLTAPGIVDMISTPFSQERNRMSGVEVHANILNNLIDGNSILDVSEKLRWISVIVLSFLCFFFFMKCSEKKSLLFWLFSLIMITTLAFYLLTAFNRWMNPALFFFSVSFMYFFAYTLKLDVAARILDMKYVSVGHILEKSKDAPLQLTFDRGLIGFLSPGGIHTKIQRLITIEEQYEKTLEDTIQQKTAQLAHALSMLNSMSNEMIMRLTAAAESKDAHTGKHISRIGLYASKISEELKMPSEFTEQLTLASAMHDIGKIGIPNRILLKAGELSPEEFEIIKSHTTIGAKILSGSDHPTIRMSATIALSHHERWDGDGYPNGLKGNNIPIEARITMICDIYDALMSQRPYKVAFDHKTTFTIITRGDVKIMPGNFDPDVLQAFVRISPIFEDIYNEYQD